MRPFKVASYKAEPSKSARIVGFLGDNKAPRRGSEPLRRQCADMDRARKYIESFPGLLAGSDVQTGR